MVSKVQSDETSLLKHLDTKVARVDISKQRTCKTCNRCNGLQRHKKESWEKRDHGLQFA